MKIIQLQAENVKRIRAVTIRPDGNVVTIAGENGQGKSSVLDSIAYALGGKDLHPPEVIRRGEERAEVVVDLGDLVVRRRWTQGGTSLTVESKDGSVLKSPQSVLDKLIGTLTFDPLAFLQLKPAAQVDTLKKLVGVDTSVIEAAHTALYEKRTAVTAKGVELRARFDAMPAPAADVPDEPVSVDALLDEQSKLQTQKAANDRIRAELAQAKTTEEMAKQQSINLEAEIAQMAAALEKQRERLAAHGKDTARHVENRMALDAQVAKLIDPDVAEVVRKISRASATNDQVRTKKERAEVEVALKAKRAEKEALTKQLDQLDQDKAKLLRAAKFPVPGLSFTMHGLTLNELPLEQASSAEQLRVAVGMALALNSKLKVVFIRDGSLLDKKSLAMVAEMAAAADAQFWIEVVGAGVGMIEIVDGHVVEPAAASNAA